MSKGTRIQFTPNNSSPRRHRGPSDFERILGIDADTGSGCRLY